MSNDLWVAPRVERQRISDPQGERRPVAKEEYRRAARAGSADRPGSHLLRGEHLLAKNGITAADLLDGQDWQPGRGER